jgi:hypothetical protein
MLNVGKLAVAQSAQYKFAPRRTPLRVDSPQLSQLRVVAVFVVFIIFVPVLSFHLVLLPYIRVSPRTPAPVLMSETQPASHRPISAHRSDQSGGRR